MRYKLIHIYVYTNINNIEPSFFDRTCLFSFQLIFYRHLQLIIAADPQGLAVDKDSGGPLDGSLLGFLHILVDQVLNRRAAHIAVELSRVQAQLLDEVLDRGIAQTRGILKQQMTELPVFPLVVGSERGSGGIARVGMHGEGKVLEDKPDIFGIFIQQLLEDGLDLPAIGSLVVAEHDDRYCSFLRTLERNACKGKIMNDIHLDDLDHIPGAAGNEDGAVSSGIRDLVECLIHRHAVHDLVLGY